MMRIFSNILILFSVLILPPYLSFLVILIFIFAFDMFVESIFWAFMIDSVYGGGLSLGINFHYIFTALAITIFFLSFKVKNMVKFYA